MRARFKKTGGQDRVRNTKAKSAAKEEAAGQRMRLTYIRIVHVEKTQGVEVAAGGPGAEVGVIHAQLSARQS